MMAMWVLFCEITGLVIGTLVPVDQELLLEDVIFHPVETNDFEYFF